MSYLLKEVQINHAACGEFLYRVFKEVYNMTTKETEQTEEEPICKKCETKRFFELLKGTGRLEPLTSIERVYKGAASEGEQILKKTGRKITATTQDDFNDDAITTKS